MSYNETLRVLGERIRALRERLQMTQETVSERLGIPRSAVSDIETAKRDVTATELFKLAQLFGEPMEHLLATESVPEDELVMLRAQAVTGDTRAELNRFVHRCREYLELEQLTNERREPDLRSPRTILSSFEQAWKLADEERKRLELGATPAHQLIQVLEERVGVKILFLQLSVETSGASLKSRQFGAAILANRRHVPGRRVFTVAHEYFHLLTDGRVARSKGAEALHVCTAMGTGGKKDRGDQLADQFAGRLLLPVDSFVEQLRSVQSNEGRINPFDLDRIGKYFGVSTQAVLVQMAALNIISWQEYKRIYENQEFQDRLLVERGDEVGPEPLRFRHLALKAYLTRQISRGRLAELLDINIAEVDRVVQQFKGAGEMGDGVRLSLPG